MLFNFVADSFHNFVADSFHTADFLQAQCDFTGKTAVLRFSPLLGLRDNVR